MRPGKKECAVIAPPPPCCLPFPYRSTDCQSRTATGSRPRVEEVGGLREGRERELRGGRADRQSRWWGEEKTRRRPSPPASLTPLPSPSLLAGRPDVDTPRVEMEGDGAAAGGQEPARAGAAAAAVADADDDDASAGRRWRRRAGPAGPLVARARSRASIVCERVGSGDAGQHARVAQRAAKRALRSGHSSPRSRSLHTHTRLAPRPVLAVSILRSVSGPHAL